MSFEKGNTHGKGRPKGSSNKEVKGLRNRINDLLDMNWDSIESDLKQLTPKERIDSYIKLLEYTLPKLNRTELKGDDKLNDLISMTSKERQLRIKELTNKLQKS